MKSGWFMLLLLGARVYSASAQISSPSVPSSAPHTIERNFVSGGQVKLSLSAGTYVIRASAAADKITIRWQTRKQDQEQRVRISADVKGSECSIDAKGPRGALRVEIELPARSDLYLRLRSGDLSVEGIEGNKDIECHAGDVTVDIGGADDYGAVDLSASVGDIEAPPLGASKGGFLRKFRWQGPGKYTLHAHVRWGSRSLLGTPSASRQPV